MSYIKEHIKGISILGSGNVGRRIGTYFEKEFNVIFYDIDNNVINELNKAGHICTMDINYALLNSDISFIAVPTPLGQNGLYDTTYLENISRDIGNYLKDDNNRNYHIFIVKSTVIPGTTENIIIPTIERYSKKLIDINFGMIYNPEFLTVINNTWTINEEFCISSEKEGRIVLGESGNKKAGDIIEEFYKKMNLNIPFDVPILRTNYMTAELTKLVANARLALSISYSNEIFLANKELQYKGINIDTDFIIDAISRDPRIGRYGSVFGKAWGGPCFLKDTVALNTYLKNKTEKYHCLISESIKINNYMKKKYGMRE